MFRFSLQRVLELKARLEQAAAIELARRRAAADDARQQCEALQAARAESLRQMSAGGRPTVGEMRNSGYLLQLLDEQIGQAQALVTEAEALATASQGVFTLASQERRVLDRLRERHLATWQTEQVDLDRKTMDDIALSRFAQSAAKETEGA